MRGEECRDLAPWNGIADRHAAVEAQLGDELLELGTVRPLLVRERRAVRVKLDVVACERHRGKSDIEPLRGRVAPEGEEPHPFTCTRRRARELLEVDSVPDRAQLLRGERERALVDARHRGRRALGRRSRRLARQCVNQRTSGTRSGRTSGAGEHGVDRAHVRNDSSAAQPAQLTRERGLEARSTQSLVLRAEGAHAAVPGKHSRNRAVGEHDDVVHELGERSDLHRGGERRMARIDLLCDEDDLRL